WRLPELFAGDARARVPWPSAYPASCRPQAWAAAAAGALVQALLGLEADMPRGRGTVTPPPRRAGAGRTRPHGGGLSAGEQTFSAGIDAGGEGYVRGFRRRCVREGRPAGRRRPSRGTSRPGQAAAW